MVGSLVFVKLAQERQERNVIRLYRLAALDKRRTSIINVIKNLKEIDDNAEVMRVLNQALKSDLLRIQKLDPARGNVDQGASSGSAKSAGADPKRSKVGDRTSLGTEREVIKARAYINDALALIRKLYQARKVSGEALESTARHLGVLSALVGVNSNIHMAEEAMALADSKKALGHYRAAESYLLNGPLKGPEGEEKLQLILSRKQQILEGAGQEYYEDRAA